MILAIASPNIAVARNVAKGGHEKEEGVLISFHDLATEDNPSIVASQYMLYGSLMLFVTRLAYHAITLVLRRTWLFLKAIDLFISGVLWCTVLIPVIIVTVYVHRDGDLVYETGTSSFLTLLVASLCTSLSMTGFEVTMLCIGDANAYTSVSDTQQREDEALVPRLHVQQEEEDGDSATERVSIGLDGTGVDGDDYDDYDEDDDTGVRQSAL